MTPRENIFARLRCLELATELAKNKDLQEYSLVNRAKEFANFVFADCDTISEPLPSEVPSSNTTKGDFLDDMAV